VVKRTTMGAAATDRFDIQFPPEGMTGAGKLRTEDGVTMLLQGRRGAMVRRKHEPLVRETFILHTATDLDQALFVSIAMSIVDIDSPSRGRLPNPGGSMP